MVIGFSCSACGRCCNSPPLLSLAELLRFEDVFVGSLTLSRAAPLALQGHEAPSLPACPALQSDGLCRLHAQGKPAMCASVPLDPRRPDGAQAIVLRRRLPGGPEDFGAQCLAEGAALPLLLVDGQIVDAGHRHAVNASRAALAEEDPLWREPLQARLAPLLGAVPADGFLSLPLTPLLELLSERGDAESARRLAQAQRSLLAQRIDAALQRKRPQDRPNTAQFRRWHDAYVGFLDKPQGRPGEDSALARFVRRAGSALEPGAGPTLASSKRAR